jgi:hypothetical protein
VLLQQIEHLQAVASPYFASLGQLYSERRSLQQQLQQQLQEQPERLLHQQLLVQQLQANLKRQHVLHLGLFACWGALTPLQYARLAMFSSPYMPDMHALLCVLCKGGWAARLAQSLVPTP